MCHIQYSGIPIIPNPKEKTNSSLELSRIYRHKIKYEYKEKKNCLIICFCLRPIEIPLYLDFGQSVFSNSHAQEVFN